MRNMITRYAPHILLVVAPYLLTGALGCASEAPAAADSTPTPGFEILVGYLAIVNGHLEVSNLLNVTEREGYDNQPQFTPDGNAVLYTSVRQDGQADIYRYDLNSKQTTRLTETPESEYSATVLPSRSTFAVVRVEADSTQRLWEFDLDGTNPRLLVANVAPVGYQAWADDHTVAFFVLGDSTKPNSLQLVDIRTGAVDSVATDIGRSLHQIPGRRAISFVDKTGEEWWIRALDVATMEITPVAPTLAGKEDYAWTPDGRILMGKDAVLHSWAPERGWEEVADLGVGGIGSITRIAVSPHGDRVAIVVN